VSISREEKKNSGRKNGRRGSRKAKGEAATPRLTLLQTDRAYHQKESAERGSRGRQRATLSFLYVVAGYRRKGAESDRRRVGTVPTEVAGVRSVG